MAVPAVPVVEVERLAATAVEEEEGEPTFEIEGLMVAEEAGILMAETRIRTEARAAGTKTARVRLTQLPESSSTTPENWESM